MASVLVFAESAEIAFVLSRQEGLYDNRGVKQRSQLRRALDTAEQLLGFGLETFLEAASGEPANAADFKRIATIHAFGDSWPRTDLLDTRSRALVSVAATAALGIYEPVRGQLRIALNSGVTPEQIVEAFIHLAAYVGVARAFDSYAIAAQVFAERADVDGAD